MDFPATVVSPVTAVESGLPAGGPSLDAPAGARRRMNATVMVSAAREARAAVRVRGRERGAEVAAVGKGCGGPTADGAEATPVAGGETGAPPRRGSAPPSGGKAAWGGLPAPAGVARSSGE